MATRQSTAERFWIKVDREGPGGCWLWTGGKTPNGYGKFGLKGRTVAVHRWAYEQVYGPIPKGLQIDHVAARGCRHRNCVNVAHLEVVTSQTNNLRGTGLAALSAQRTHCPRGHKLSGVNLYLAPGSGKRVCRTCNRANALAYYHRKRRRA